MTAEKWVSKQTLSLLKSMFWNLLLHRRFNISKEGVLRVNQKSTAQKVEVAAGRRKADLVLKNARIVNVFTESVEMADIAIDGGYITGIGSYEGETEKDLEGAVVCPGFLDGHIHLESSMMSPANFEKAVLPHGTTGVVTDPHEIANVAGTEGIRYMMEAAKDLMMDVFFMLPSCVPSTGLDEAGAVLDAAALEPFYEKDRVLGLAEMMNSYGVVQADQTVLDKMDAALAHGKRIDGHAPFLSGNGLNAYVAAGVTSDHECSDAAEAMEKLSRGQWIMIREGTAAKNMEALKPLFEAPYYHRCMLVTDDRHPGDLKRQGHMDYLIRLAVSRGADPVRAIKMASYQTAQYFGLSNRGAVAPGYLADLVVVDNLESFQVKEVYKNGCLAASGGELCREHVKSEEKLWDECIRERVFDSFHMKELTEEDFRLDVPETKTQPKLRVIGLCPNELLTESMVVPFEIREGVAPGVDLEHDIVKMAVLERHHNTGHIGLGFLAGYGLKRGAVASSVAHDSHNLMIAGTNDRDMVLAGNCVRKNKGGLAVVMDGKVIGELPLPIAGLMTDAPAEEIDEKLRQMKEELRNAGIPDTVDPFMTLAFASLPVIPKWRLNTYGLIDVNCQKVIGIWED